MHRILWLGLLAVAGIAIADTNIGQLEPATGTWRVYRGSSFATLVCSAASEDAAKACAAADAETRKTSTRYQIRYPNRYLTVTYSVPAPTPSAKLIYGPIGGPYASLEGARVSGSVNVQLDTCLAGAWEFRVDGNAINTEYGCPITLVGDDQAYDTKALSDGTHRIEVRGSSTIAASFAVANGSPTPTPPPASGTAVLNWTPVTTHTDGSPVANLAGYRIVYGASPVALVQTIQVANPSASTGTVPLLTPGTWYFAVKAYTNTGTESDPSTVVSKIIQ